MADQIAAVPPYAIAVYEAIRALLKHGQFARLEIGPGELEGDITVGLHAGWGDGEFVVMSEKGKTEMGLASCDASVARELAAAARLRRSWLTTIQAENSCPATGGGCLAKRCGCLAEMEMLIRQDEQIAALAAKETDMEMLMRLDEQIVAALAKEPGHE